MHPLHDYVAKQLAEGLRSRHIVVWYDEREEFQPYQHAVWRMGGCSRPPERARSHLFWNPSYSARLRRRLMHIPLDGGIKLFPIGRHRRSFRKTAVLTTLNNLALGLFVRQGITNVASAQRAFAYHLDRLLQQLPVAPQASNVV